MKGRVITLVGADGAGKTTQARRVVEALGDRAVYVYMGSNPAAATHQLPTTRLWIALKRAAGRPVHHAGPPEPGPAPRPATVGRRVAAHLKSLLMVALRASEELYRLALVSRRARRGIHVVLDRHPWADHRMGLTKAEIGWLRWGDRLHRMLIARLYPRPKEIVLLDAPAERLHARKPEGSLEALRARRQEYLELVRALPESTGVVVLDAAAPPERITGRILELLGAEGMEGGGTPPGAGSMSGAAAPPSAPDAEVRSRAATPGTVPAPHLGRSATSGRPTSAAPGRRVLAVVLTTATALAAACDRPASATDVAPRNPDTLRVMTFNIFHDGERAAHGIPPWNERRAGVVEAVEAADPDVVGLQEAKGWQVSWLLEMLPGYDAVARAVVADADDEGAETVAILYRRDSFTLDDSGHFWYSPTPDEPGTHGDRSFGELSTPTMATWALLRRPGEEEGFYLFNTHLVADEGASDPVLARARSVELLVRRMAGRARPEAYLVLTGDLNMRSSDPVLRYLLGERCSGSGCPEPALAPDPALHLIDAWTSRHPDESGAGTRCNAITGGRGDRIDYVLLWDPAPTCTAGLGPCDAPAILDASVPDWGSACPSDHRPVTATVVLP